MRKKILSTMLFISVISPISTRAISINFMEIDYLTEWPRKVYSGNDHYSFNIKIVDESSKDSVVKYWIKSKVGKDSANVVAIRAKDSSYHSSVYVEGSVQNGEIKVAWVDTIICSYKNVSDTVFHENVLGIRRPALGIHPVVGTWKYDLVGRKLNTQKTIGPIHKRL